MITIGATIDSRDVRDFCTPAVLSASGHCGPWVTQHGEGEGRVLRESSPSKQEQIDFESCRAKKPTFKRNEVKLQAPTLEDLESRLLYQPWTTDCRCLLSSQPLHPKPPRPKRARVLQLGPEIKVVKASEMLFPLGGRDKAPNEGTSDLWKPHKIRRMANVQARRTFNITLSKCSIMYRYSATALVYIYPKPHSA